MKISTKLIIISREIKRQAVNAVFQRSLYCPEQCFYFAIQHNILIEFLIFEKIKHFQKIENKISKIWNLEIREFTCRVFGFFKVIKVSIWKI